MNPIQAIACLCFNCRKAVDDNKLSRCSKCKVARYCSKVCQKEHWLVKHKKHCKYLSGDAKFPGWEEHDDWNCFTCRDVRQNQMKYKMKSSEHLMCFKHVVPQVLKKTFSDDLGGGTGSVGLPFSLGEVTGDYLDNTDKLLAASIVLIENVGFRSEIIEKDAIELYSAIIDCRLAYWFEFISLEYDPSFPRDILKLIQKLDAKLGYEKIDNGVDCWQAFLLIFSVIRQRGHCQLWPFPEAVEKAGFVLDKMDVDVFTTESGQVKVKTVKKIKEELSEKDLKPNSAILCSTCATLVAVEKAHLLCDTLKWLRATQVENNAKTVTVEHFDLNAMFQDKRLQQPFILAPCFLMKLTICCGVPSCREATFRAINNCLEFSTLPVNLGIKCASCSKYSQKTHRCSRCKSKLYCSSECQAQDWRKVHSKVCEDYKEDGKHVTLGAERRRNVVHNQARLVLSQMFI